MGFRRGWMAVALAVGILGPRLVLARPGETASSPVDTEQVAQAVQGLSDPNPSVRIASINALAKHQDLRHAQDVAKLLSDDNPQVRRVAVYCLGKFGEHGRMGDEAYSPQLAGLLSDEDPLIRAAALYALGTIGDKRYAADAIRHLADGDPTARAHAARALKYMGDPKGVRALAKCLSDEDHRVRSKAAEAIAELTGNTWPSSDEAVESARRWWADHEKGCQDPDCPYGCARRQSSPSR